jgi:DNA mismatch repair protein PMS2
MLHAYLLRSIPIELPADEEMLVIDHMDIFKKNGFDFEVDDHAIPTQKLRLIAYPFSKSTTFGIQGTFRSNSSF